MDPREAQEEIAFLRQTCNSLQIRGHYAECIKKIEDNLDFLYRKERWPEQFFSMLRLHQRCYPSLNKDQPHDEYMEALLKKHRIPHIFAHLLRGPDSAITWTAEYFRDRAITCQNDEDYESALAYSDLVIKIEPGSASACLIKGRILDDMGRGADALAMYNTALDLSPSNRHALSTLARHYAKTDAKVALDYVAKALEQSPGEAGIHALKAEVLHLTGDRDGAMAALDEAVNCDPYNPEYPYLRGELYMEEGKSVSAIPQYRIAVALNEKHVPSLMRLAEAGSEHQPDLALTYVNTVITMEPQNKTASLMRARLLQRTGELAAARGQYRAHLELDPQCHEAMGGLGSLALIEEDYEGALAWLEQAVALAPNTVAYRLDKAKAHQRLEQRDAAVSEYKAALALDRNDPRAWAQLGYLNEEQNPGEAVNCFTKALALDPENAHYLMAKGELLLRVNPKNSAQAMELLGAASRRDPANPELHRKLAQLLERAENYTSAIEHYQSAVNLDQTHADTYYRLARLLIETAPEMALLHLNSAIGLSVGNSEYYYWKAKVLERLGHSEDILPRLAEVSASLDGDPEVMREFSEIMEGASPKLAMLYINRAIEQEPDNPAFLCARAHLFYRTGQKNKALEQYEKLLKKNPDQHEALFGVARILAAKGDKKALEHFDRAIALAPGIPEYRAEKAAFIAPMEDRYEEAVREYTVAIELNKLAWTVILEKARLVDAHDDVAAALTDYRHTLLVNRECLVAAARMGAILSDLKPQIALPYLEQAIRLDPDHYAHYAYKAKVLFFLGKRDQAVECCRKAVELGGNEEQTHFKLASILAAASPETAMVYCNLALETSPNKAEYHLLLGQIHKTLSDYSAARQEFEKAAQLRQKYHEVMEHMAELSLLERSPDTLERTAIALSSRPDCPHCLITKARAHSDLHGDHAAALACVEQALAQSPENLDYQELLVDILQRKKAFFRIMKEKRKLEKLRKEQEALLDLPEPPGFGADEQDPAQPEETAAAPDTQPQPASTPEPAAEHADTPDKE